VVGKSAVIFSNSTDRLHWLLSRLVMISPYASPTYFGARPLADSRIMTPGGSNKSSAPFCSSANQPRPPQPVIHLSVGALLGVSTEATLSSSEGPFPSQGLALLVAHDFKRWPPHLWANPAPAMRQIEGHE